MEKPVLAVFISTPVPPKADPVGIGRVGPHRADRLGPKRQLRSCAARGLYEVDLVDVPEPGSNQDATLVRYKANECGSTHVLVPPERLDHLGVDGGQVLESQGPVDTHRYRVWGVLRRSEGQERNKGAGEHAASGPAG
jgi:hypothetical protein